VRLASLAKCRDKKTARGDGAVLYGVEKGINIRIL